MAKSTEQPDANAGSWLVHQWVVAGIVSAAARFLPVPFVDDVVRNQCRRFVVSRTLAAHGRSESLDQLAPYYVAAGDGCLAGCLTSTVRATTKLVLFPVRKIVALVTSARGVPLEILRVVLLGRTLDRQLQKGEIDAARAARLRVAFEQAFARLDLRVVRALTNDALSSVSGWRKAAVDSARRVLGSPDDPDVVQKAEPTVEAGAAEIQQALDRPEMLELFAEFDRRVDEALAEA
jgi:hypothetical protein